MAQGFIAGATSYENQSLTDIVEDISYWITYSGEQKKLTTEHLAKLKTTDFYACIPYNYKAMIHEMPQICQTNIDDLSRVLTAISSRCLSKENIDLFRKIGRRAIENGNDNRKYYKSRDEGYWHDYDNPDFRIVEEIYASFGDYCATLWDIGNAAARLQDYIDVPNEVTVVKYENNSVNIGNNNQISNSVIGSQNTAEIEQESVIPDGNKESLVSKGFWQIIIPLVVTVLGAALCVWLGIN